MIYDNERITSNEVINMGILRKWNLHIMVTYLNKGGKQFIDSYPILINNFFNHSTKLTVDLM